MNSIPEKASIAGFLRLAILQILLDQPDQYMTELLDKVNDRTGSPVTKGGLDFCLKQMKNSGYLTATGDHSTAGRIITRYKVTNEGVIRANDDLSICLRLTSPLSRVRDYKIRDDGTVLSVR